MDEGTFDALKEDIASRLTCNQEGYSFVNDFPEDLEDYWLCHLRVGHDEINLEVRVKYDKQGHRSGEVLTVWGPESNQGHTFREKKAGGFNTPNVAKKIDEIMAAEAAHRQQTLRERQLLKTAENIVKRAERGGVPPNVMLQPEKDGSVSLGVSDMDEEILFQLLKCLRAHSWGRRKKSADKKLWDHLKEDDIL